MKYTLKLNIVVNIIKNRNKNSNGMKTLSRKARIFLTYENWLTASHVKCTQCENPKWFESVGLQKDWLPPAVSRGIHGLTHLTELPEIFLNLFVQSFWRTSVLFVQPLIPVLDFRPNLTWVSNPGWMLSLECFVTCLQWNPQIFSIVPTDDTFHLETCDTEIM